MPAGTQKNSLSTHGKEFWIPDIHLHKSLVK